MDKPNELLRVDIVSFDHHSGGRLISHSPLWLRPTDDDVVTIADDSELIQCRTYEGSRVTIFLGHPHERKGHAATIIIGTEDKQTT
jgi:hypothetical protein